MQLPRPDDKGVGAFASRRSGSRLPVVWWNPQVGDHLVRAITGAAGFGAGRTGGPALGSAARSWFIAVGLPSGRSGTLGPGLRSEDHHHQRYAD